MITFFFFFSAKRIFRRSGIKTNEALVFHSSTIERNVKRPHLHFESRNFASGYVRLFERRRNARDVSSFGTIFLLNTGAKVESFGYRDEDKFDAKLCLARIGQISDENS